MCSVIILRRPGHPWPVLIGANRDEMQARPWQGPGRYWPQLPKVRAGQDLNAGGTWQGINDQGVQAAVLNRFGSLGPAPGKRSRGELPLLALAEDNAGCAAQVIAELDPSQYQPFNMLVADSHQAFWLANRGEAISLQRVPEGLSMLTAHDLNDTQASPRMAHNLPRFRLAQVPDPAKPNWQAWQQLLGFEGEQPPDPAHFDIRADALCIRSNIGFQTVSSSLIALPATGQPLWWFDGGQGFALVAD
ncbi:NRDE family protein [Gallaecimonas xiamenensis]|uniref:NRDE family protein n=1 Tax=Gallaecimonas xiamenensis 3-C-1 TaxID=745411 RepID=K2JKJ9_9GAMM|nr:hypothetical protein B3C1_08816 [Gallaecimonas xiamenensis 3-C-1]